MHYSVCALMQFLFVSDVAIIKTFVSLWVVVALKCKCIDPTLWYLHMSLTCVYIVMSFAQVCNVHVQLSERQQHRHHPAAWWTSSTSSPHRSLVNVSNIVINPQLGERHQCRHPPWQLCLYAYLKAGRWLLVVDVIFLHFHLGLSTNSESGQIYTN